MIADSGSRMVVADADTVDAGARARSPRSSEARAADTPRARSRATCWRGW